MRDKRGKSSRAPLSALFALNRAGDEHASWGVFSGSPFSEELAADRAVPRVDFAAKWTVSGRPRSLLVKKAAQMHFRKALQFAEYSTPGGFKSESA
jgi:hypothetical protein